MQDTDQPIPKRPQRLVVGGTAGPVAVAAPTNIQAYQGSRQASPRRYRQRMTRLAAVVKLSTSSGADQASDGGKAAVSTAKARMASKDTT